MSDAAHLAADLIKVLEPVSVFERVIGDPDLWQNEVLTGTADALLNCSRQSGKSTTVAAAAVDLCNRRPGSLALLMSPSLRQSGEIYRKAADFNRRAGWVPVVNESALRFELSNGSRLISLPGTEKTVRGFSAVDFLAVDEAARVDVALYRAITPMLAVSGGRLLALSTPWGSRGWWFDEWVKGEGWERFKVPATDCPRIPADFLERERRRLPSWFFNQEYFCEFSDAVDAVFRSTDIDAAITPDLAPLWGAVGGGVVPDASDDDDDPLRPLWADEEVTP